MLVSQGLEGFLSFGYRVSPNDSDWVKTEADEILVETVGIIAENFSVDAESRYIGLGKETGDDGGIHYPTFYNMTVPEQIELLRQFNLSHLLRIHYHDWSKICDDDFTFLDVVRLAIHKLIFDFEYQEDLEDMPRRKIIRSAVYNFS